MTSGSAFDVVVVGGGMAGLCCAGELVRQGASVALIAETPEVAWNIRTKNVAGNVGWMQHPVWNAAWGGGYWFQLVRALGIPVQFEFTPPITLILHGDSPAAGTTKLPFETSAPGLVDTLGLISPIPIDPVRDELVELFQAGLEMDFATLSAMAEVPLATWLAERKASPVAQAILFAMAGAWLFTTPDVGAEHISVFGLFGAVRIMQCAEAPVLTIKPDPWTGLALPIAAKIEALGGVIHRGTKVEQVLIEGDRATGVRLADGRTVEGRAVAIAAGASRIPALLDPMPEEVREAVDYARLLDLKEIDLFAVLREPVITVDTYTLVMDPANFKFLLYLSPLHALGPWSTKPGKQFIIVEALMAVEEYDRLGGREAVLARTADLLEELFPGYHDAVEATDVLVHRHLWQSSMTHGPKLPRRSAAVPGLYFVGDGSRPVLSIGIEYAAGAGILGAGDILADLRPAGRR
ncbi:MAG TPA: FAD-dependent oxidoreductase [Acidimicrobiia bacterium]|nr:FAD-dependent oxidoreductase [Acidimicrobiia bacterium]